MLDLQFLVFLHHKLFKDFDLLSQRSPFQEFLYSCILVHKSGFYNKFKKGLIIDGNNTNNNVNTSNDNNQQGGDQFRSLFEGFLEIREGYVFMDLATTISKNPIPETTNEISDEEKGKKKNQFIKTYLKKMDIPIDEQMLIFFDEINDLISKIHSVRDEFVDNKIGYCNEILKSVFLRAYVNYLKKGGNDMRRPISIKNHFDKFLVGAIKNLELKFIGEEVMKLIPQTRVTVTKEGQNYTFPDCGERTLMNFFKYLLFDIKEGYITKENLEQFNGKYQGNLLKEIFNDGLISYVNDREQTEYLYGKRDDFATLLSEYSKKINSSIFVSGVCELKPSVENVLKMVYFLVNGNQSDTTVKPVFIIDLLAAFVVVISFAIFCKSLCCLTSIFFIVSLAL